MVKNRQANSDRPNFSDFMLLDSFIRLLGNMIAVDGC